MWDGYDCSAGWLGALTLLGLTVAAGALLTRRPSGSGSGHHSSRRDPALELARERFARGDVSPEEYMALRRALEH